MRNPKLILINLLLLLFAANSCQVEEFSPSPTEINSVESSKKINRAFLTHKLSNQKMKLIWKSAITFENVDAVEVNFTLDKKYYKPLSKNNKISGRQRLLLTFDKKGLITETIIEYRPSDNFTGDIKEINSSNFKNNFEGEVSFKNPLDDHALIWVITNGSIIQKLIEKKQKIKNNTKKSAGYESCQWNTVNYWLCVGSGTEESCFYTSQDLYQCFWIEDTPNPDPYDCSTQNWPWCSEGGGSGGGGGGENPPSPGPLSSDPCTVSATTSNTFQNSNFPSAKSSILNAGGGIEHSITFGKDTNNQITQAPMRNGGGYAVATNTTWPGAFAAMHNHIENSPISSGDIYASIELNVTNSNFRTSFIVLPDGSVYAIVVNNLELAKIFLAAYPADVKPGYNPEFPDYLFNQMQDLVTNMGSSVDGRTRAMAYILTKYASGLTIMKQDNNQNFVPYKTEMTIPNGERIYTPKFCN
ncbi:hypothetical protein [Flavobacterium sp. N2038]|uniref:hypothetical protein n=1 Tax=Flavobacterium sp. N2038 TaxID=2986829 RepID=UPI00222565E3|nr:hypothetical protein [Flavobacterium sp. N2038]